MASSNSNISFLCSKTCGARAEAGAAMRAIILLACLTAPGLLRAQSLFQRDRSFWFYFENDAFGGTSDSSYTNGVRAGWEFAYGSPRLGKVARWLSFEGVVDAVRSGSIRPADRACVPQESRTTTQPCLTIAFGISQTIYTPSNIIDTTLQRDDRPFAGLAYASAIVNTLRHPWQYSSELQVGVIGPWSAAESAQSLAHWTWASTSEKPRGWHHQLRNRLQVGLVNTYHLRLLEWCQPHRRISGVPACRGTASEERRFDLTARSEAALGTHITRGSAGFIMRAGKRFPDAIALTRISTTAPARATQDKRPFFWFAGYLTGDIRYVARNAFITGTPADDEPGRFGFERTITFKRNVGEASAGAMIGLGSLMVSYQRIRRTKEYEPGGGSHVFGAITFSLFTPKG